MQKTYFLICIFIVFITLLSFFSQAIIIRQILFSNTRKLIQAAHQQCYDNIDQYFNNLENSAISIGYNASVQRFLQESDTNYQYSLFPDVQTVFSGLSMSQNDIQGYALYDRNGEHLVANGSSYQAIIQSDTIEQNSHITYSCFSSSNPYIGVTVPYYVTIIPVLESNSQILTNNRIGTIVLTINLSFIKSQIETGNQLKGCNMVLTDEIGHEIIAIGRDADLSEDVANNASYIVFDNTFPNNGWRLVTFFEKGIIAEDMKPLLFTAIIISLLIVTVVLIFILLMSKRFISPIKHISRFMSNVSHGASENISKSIPPYHLPKKWDYIELSSMSEAMNDMLHSLEDKTSALLQKEKQFYEVDLARHRTEVLAYRNQINPHFLYNTFECIKGIALSRNAPEIVEITQALSLMFRHIVKGNDFVTIEEEMNHVNEYAIIIFYRFMGRITIEIDVSPEASLLYIPRIILQPLVENAVFHGLEKKLGAGMVQVSIFERNQYIHIIVSDNGTGMDEQTYNNVLSNLEDPSNPNGIGLTNIAHRLKLLYSGDSEIRITSTQDVGTNIELILPVIKEEINVPSYRSR